MKGADKTKVVSVCIDDFALKKRQRYGTIMVDFNTHKIIDMIETREAHDIVAWLKEYPHIRVVSRDGSRAYATAISEAHPKAIQVSDRFHLLKGLTDQLTLILQKLFQGRIAIPITDETRRNRAVMLLGTMRQRVELVKELRKKGLNQGEICANTGASKRTIKKLIETNEKDIPFKNNTSRGRSHDEAVEKLKHRAELVRILNNEGFSFTEIAQRTGFCANTVRNYLSTDFSPVNAHYGKQREGKLLPFRGEVLRLKSEGLKYREIYGLIEEKGYTGTQAAVRGFVAKERRIHQSLLLNASGGPMELIDKKWLIRLLYRPIEKLKGITPAQLHTVFSIYPVYKSILSIVERFKETLKSKNPEAIVQWINSAAALKIDELDTFIEGLRLDVDAVKNAIELDYNNGLAEGFVNKIKVIKRIMYGRCKFSLLKNKSLLLSEYA